MPNIMMGGAQAPQQAQTTNGTVGGYGQSQPQPPQQGTAPAPAGGGTSNQAMMMGLPPEIRAKLMKVPEPKRSELLQRLSQDYNGIRESLSSQEAMAGELRGNIQMPEGRQAGRMYVASNPLEGLGAYAQHRKANNMQQEAIDEKKALADDYGMATQDMMRMMLQK